MAWAFAMLAVPPPPHQGRRKDIVPTKQTNSLGLPLPFPEKGGEGTGRHPNISLYMKKACREKKAYRQEQDNNLSSIMIFSKPSSLSNDTATLRNKEKGRWWALHFPGKGRQPGSEPNTFPLPAIFISISVSQSEMEERGHEGKGECPYPGVMHVWHLPDPMCVAGSQF